MVAGGIVTDTTLHIIVIIISGDPALIHFRYSEVAELYENRDPLGFSAYPVKPTKTLADSEARLLV